MVRGAEPAFYPDLSVGGHLKLPQRRSATDHDDVVEAWHLTEMLPVSPSPLSSGQRQRLFLATQLTLPAELTVIDEPERHLDQDWVEFLCAELRSIARAGTVVIDGRGVRPITYPYCSSGGCVDVPI